MKEIIEIKEEIQIGGVILEKGDKIEILKENFFSIDNKSGRTIIQTETPEKTINWIKTSPIIGREAILKVLSDDMISIDTYSLVKLALHNLL